MCCVASHSHAHVLHVLHVLQLFLSVARCDEAKLAAGKSFEPEFLRDILKRENQPTKSLLKPDQMSSSDMSEVKKAAKVVDQSEVFADLLFSKYRAGGKGCFPFVDFRIHLFLCFRHHGHRQERR